MKTTNQPTLLQEYLSLFLLAIAFLIAFYFVFLLPCEDLNELFYQVFKIGIPVFIMGVLLIQISESKIVETVANGLFLICAFYGFVFLITFFIYTPLKMIGVSFANADKHVVLFNGNNKEKIITLGEKEFTIPANNYIHIKRRKNQLLASSFTSDSLQTVSLFRGMNILVYGNYSVIVNQYLPMTDQYIQTRKMVDKSIAKAMGENYRNFAANHNESIYDRKTLFKVANGIKYFKSKSLMDLNLHDKRYNPVPKKVLSDRYEGALTVIELAW